MSTQGMEKKGHICKCSTAIDPLRSLSVHKPNFLNNKCLVIKGIGKELNIPQIYNKINVIAGKLIRFLHKSVILSKNSQKFRTIGFELNDEDYNILIDEHIWDKTIQF